MHRFVVLVAFGVGSVLAITEECSILAHAETLRCCKRPLPLPPRDESIKECFEKLEKYERPGTDSVCELELCIGKKKGYAAADGTINKKILEANIADKFKQSPELVGNIKNNCIYADVQQHGPEGFCELMKISRCIHVQIAMACPEYDDKDHCSDIKRLAETCKTA